MNVVNIKGQTVDANDFCGAILGSCFQTYSWYRGFAIQRPYKWDLCPEDHDQDFVTISVEDPTYGSTVTKHQSVNKMLSAYKQLTTGKTTLHWENFDASDADVVIQKAMFDQLVYA